MIIDKIQLAGLDAYFHDPNNLGQINLAGQVTSRTKPLGKGKQLEVSAIELLIESDSDLTDLFNFQSKPLFSVTVMKEMFPALFADPFRHRVHNIGGFEDFKRGTLENGKVMEIDGIPTIVSVGTKTCKWTSPLYPMPEPVSINHASWELAASRKTPPENFKYSLKLLKFDASQNLIQTIHLTNPNNPSQSGNLDPTKPRKAENFDLKDVGFYQIEFTADVKKDASIYQKHTTLIGESIGTPLLKAVNLIEPVKSVYDIYSLQELLSLSSEYHLFEFQGQPIKKMLVTLDISATLVHSEYETIASNNPNDPKSFYEFIEITVNTDQLSNFEAKLKADILLRVTRREF